MGHIFNGRLNYELMFEGELLDGQRWNGKGIIEEDGDVIFEGYYINGRITGEYREFIPYSNVYFIGKYLYGHRWKGKYYLDSKFEYEGEFLYDKKWNGKGYDEDGNVIYENNNGNGKIKEYNNYGKLIFEGEYLNGKRNGQGKEYDKKGNLIFEGVYLNGEKQASK